MKHVTYNGLTFEPFITREQIQARVKELAADITRDCGDKRPIFLCVLKGAFAFCSDLFRACDFDAEITFIRLKSYEGTGSTGVVKTVMGLQDDIKGRTLIIVEDIIDTGRTMKGLLQTLWDNKPDDIKIASLIYKPQSNVTDVRPDYVGFEIPTKFIIGYGLDLDGMARNLPDIYAVVK